VNAVTWPTGWRLESLTKSHRRRDFISGQIQVDDWLHTKALQNQSKHLSITKVLIDDAEVLAGYYTLATGQVDFSDLPAEIVKKLPRRVLPVAIVAWLGVNKHHQGQGLGERLLAQALRDCRDAGKTFAFVAVILDCINGAAKAFYQKFGFSELPGHPYRLFISTAQLEAMMAGG